MKVEITKCDSCGEEIGDGSRNHLVIYGGSRVERAGKTIRIAGYIDLCESSCLAEYIEDLGTEVDENGRMK